MNSGYLPPTLLPKYFDLLVPKASEQQPSREGSGPVLDVLIVNPSPAQKPSYTPPAYLIPSPTYREEGANFVIPLEIATPVQNAPQEYLVNGRRFEVVS
jgi:hypothetical protein